MLARLRAPAFRKTWIPAVRFNSNDATISDIKEILSSLPLDPPSHIDSPPLAGASGYPAPKGSTKPNAFAHVPVTRLRLHCHSTHSNTISTLTKGDGSTIAWFSGGSCGFKKANRATYEAGYQCAARIFKKIEEVSRRDGSVKVDIFLKGFGQGRDALKAALLATEGEPIRSLVDSITDRTPIKIGGTRAKKALRN